MLSELKEIFKDDAELADWLENSAVAVNDELVSCVWWLMLALYEDGLPVNSAAYVKKF